MMVESMGVLWDQPLVAWMVSWMVDWMVYSLDAMKVDKKDDG